ncbi:CAT RNA binding domain-containing protein [Thermovenabulum sp.]
MGFKILKVLNNNAVMAIDEERNREAVLLGRGIGFEKEAY